MSARQDYKEILKALLGAYRALAATSVYRAGFWLGLAADRFEAEPPGPAKDELGRRVAELAGRFVAIKRNLDEGRY